MPEISTSLSKDPVFSEKHQELVALVYRLRSRLDEGDGILPVLRQMQSTLSSMEEVILGKTTDHDIDDLYDSGLVPGGLVSSLSSDYRDNKSAGISPLMNQLGAELSSESEDGLRLRILGLLASIELIPENKEDEDREAFNLKGLRDYVQEHMDPEFSPIPGSGPLCAWPNLPSFAARNAPIMRFNSGIFSASFASYQVTVLPKIKSQVHVEQIAGDISKIVRSPCKPAGWIIDASALDSMPVVLQAIFLGCLKKFTRAKSRIRIFWLRESVVDSWLQKQFTTAFRLEKVGMFYFSAYS